MMRKPELRNFYKSKRNQLSATEIHECSLGILQSLKQLPIWEHSVFHVFVPIVQNNEINTFPIIEYLFEKNKTVIVPKVEGKNMINSQISTKTEWTTGKFGVSEPFNFIEVNKDSIEVVLLPMLICDKSGNRIGYGGGYYDRFLSEFENSPLKIGLNFFSPIDFEFELSPFDVPLDYCVTPEEIVSFDS